MSRRKKKEEKFLVLGDEKGKKALVDQSLGSGRRDVELQSVLGAIDYVITSFRDHQLHA